MNLNGALNIGRNGITAAAQGTAVASQNLANAATDGYARRTVQIDPIPLQQGGGARATAPTRINDAFLTKRSLSAGAQSGEASGRVQTLQVLDSIFGDETGDVGAAIDAFEAAMADFSSRPADAATRQGVLAKAGQLSAAFNQASGALADARAAANSDIARSIDTVNRQVDTIAQLSSDIAIARGRQHDVGDLLDQRDRLVRELSKTIPVTTIEDSRGNFSLMLSGSYALVDATGQAHALQANLDPGSGDVRVFRAVAGLNEDVTRFLNSGTVGGTIAARDGALSQAQTALDQLAFDMSQAYNTVHAEGIGLDGTSGRNLFTDLADVSGAATAFSVSSDVLGQPNNLAGALSADSLPGDNRNALSLVGIADQKIIGGGRETAQSAFGSLLAGGATALRSAMDRQSQADATLSQVDAMRESLTGVSSDDEMISLMRYQRAYQASLRVIETADQMLQQLMSLGR